MAEAIAPSDYIFGRWRTPGPGPTSSGKRGLPSRLRQQARDHWIHQGQVVVPDHIFHQEHNKAGFLGWASGKTGTRVLVEDDDELWYRREFFRPLFVFMDKKADQLERLADRNEDNDLKKAVRLFCGDSQNRQENIRTGSMTMFLVNIRKFVEIFQLLGHYRVPRGLVQTNMQTKIERGLATLWSHQGIDANVYGRRKQCLAAITKQLLRSAQKGPDVPLHIVFDGPTKCVPRCVLVPAILDEVVIRTADILCLLFGSGDMPRYSTITNSFDVMSELDERQNHF
jgi:hypothetical protein